MRGENNVRTTIRTKSLYGGCTADATAIKLFAAADADVSATANAYDPDAAESKVFDLWIAGMRAKREE